MYTSRLVRALSLADLVGEYRPGTRVPWSGIYDVTHDNGHRIPHQVTAIEGKKFPPCRKCGHGVKSRLNQKADHLHDHLEFDNR